MVAVGREQMPRIAQQLPLVAEEKKVGVVEEDILYADVGREQMLRVEELMSQVAVDREQMPVLGYNYVMV